MRVQGTYLRSIVACRVFWSLLLAVLLPLAIFGALGYRTLAAQFQDEARRHHTEQLKLASFRTFDRLTAARAVLTTHAQSADWSNPVPDDGGAPHGDAHLAATWRRPS